MNQRQVYDPKLDRLYMKTVKCPYCKHKIRALQAVCPQCGIHKMQIANASNQTAKQMMKDGEHGKVVMLGKRPNDVKFSVLCSWLLLGLFGAHCFYVGRRTRGWIMLGLVAVCIICVIIFPMGEWGTILDPDGAEVETFIGQHEWRAACVNIGWPFPTDFLGLAAFVMWALDSFAIVFGWFKYPVRLGENPNAKKTAGAANLR